MARLISTLLVLGLLGGSAAAFAITEELKLEKSPITGTRIPTAYSPTCRCRSAVALIRFRLRKPDSVTATVLDPDGDTVQTIAAGRDAPKGYLTLRWDGRNQAGAIVPEGGYRIRVHLARRHETITIPNTIQVDMTPPKISIVRIRPTNGIFSPDGDGHRDHVAIKFDVNEVARPLLLINGRRAIRGRLTHVTGILQWSGRIDHHRLPPGRYAVALRGQDVAGNRGPATHPHFVVIRYVSVASKVVHAKPGHRLTIKVSSDARRIYWHLHGKKGVARPGRITLKAPVKHGRYLVVFRALDHYATAHVVVRGKK